ncbi:hypothetical protein Tco_0079769 [Tanacetum coccineum]
METIHVTFNELTAMAFEQFSSRLELQSMTPVTSSSGLVSNLVPQQPFNLPTRNDWDCLFQPMFDEYFNPPQSPFSPVPVVVAPRAVDIAGSPSSTTIDLDAPSSSTSSTNQQQQSLIISQGVEESIPNALFDDLCHEPLHDVSNSQESSSNVQSSHSLLELIVRLLGVTYDIDWDWMSTPTQCWLWYHGIERVSILRKVKLGSLASETVGLHAEFIS